MVCSILQLKLFLCSLLVTPSSAVLFSSLHKYRLKLDLPISFLLVQSRFTLSWTRFRHGSGLDLVYTQFRLDLVLDQFKFTPTIHSLICSSFIANPSMALTSMLSKYSSYRFLFVFFTFRFESSTIIQDSECAVLQFNAQWRKGNMYIFEENFEFTVNIFLVSVINSSFGNAVVGQSSRLVSVRICFLKHVTLFNTLLNMQKEFP